MFVLRMFKWLFEFIFAKELAERRRVKEKQREFLEKFPCPHCRPDGCTFYWDIPCTCEVCGRKYYI